MEVKLIIVSGKVGSKDIVVRRPMILGRAKGIGIVIPHPSVSERHCLLFEHAGFVMVQDLNSEQGTFVGGRKAITVPLPPGTEFSVGPLTFRVEYNFSGNGEAMPKARFEDADLEAAAPRSSSSFSASSSTPSASEGSVSSASTATTPIASTGSASVAGVPSTPATSGTDTSFPGSQASRSSTVDTADAPRKGLESEVVKEREAVSNGVSDSEPSESPPTFFTWGGPETEMSSPGREESPPSEIPSFFGFGGDENSEESRGEAPQVDFPFFEPTSPSPQGSSQVPETVSKAQVPPVSEVSEPSAEDPFSFDTARHQPIAESRKTEPAISREKETANPFSEESVEDVQGESETGIPNFVVRPKAAPSPSESSRPTAASKKGGGWLGLFGKKEGTGKKSHGTVVPQAPPHVQKSPPPPPIQKPPSSGEKPPAKMEFFFPASEEGGEAGAANKEAWGEEPPDVASLTRPSAPESPPVVSPKPTDSCDDDLSNFFKRL